MGNNRNGRAFVSLLVIVGLFLIARHFLLPRRITADDIRRDPQAYKGRKVALSGTVAGGASLGGALFNSMGGGGSFFILDDGTGQIGVTTSGPAPSAGQRVRVKGKVDVVASLSIPGALGQLAGMESDAAAMGTVTLIVVRANRVSSR